jgi:hypothetical protein
MQSLLAQAAAQLRDGDVGAAVKDWNEKTMRRGSYKALKRLIW